MADSDLYQTQGPKQRSVVLPWLLFVLALCGLGAAGYYGKGFLDAAEARAEAARAEATLAGVRLAALETEKRAALERLEDLEGQRSQLATERESLSQEVAAKDAELQRLRATYESLEDKMKEEIAKGEIRLSRLAGRVQVDLVDKILFDSGEATLSARGEEVLARVGGVLAKVDDKQIQVSGHTDDSPPSEKLKAVYPSNWELSVARAVNVTRFLHEKASVPARRLVAAGHGQYHPIASNKDHAGRARNRRIEILLTPVLEKERGAVASAAPRPAAAKVVPASTRGGKQAGQVKQAAGGKASQVKPQVKKASGKAAQQRK